MAAALEELDVVCHIPHEAGRCVTTRGGKKRKKDLEEGQSAEYKGLLLLLRHLAEVWQAKVRSGLSGRIESQRGVTMEGYGYRSVGVVVSHTLWSRSIGKAFWW